MLANLEGITIEAAFILKDLHRHMDDPVVIRRLRDVGQRFATNKKTVILTAPKIEIRRPARSVDFNFGAVRMTVFLFVAKR